ncbi:sensor histidine kinase [Massilia sp. S19_KUP03_FR1]|uniref:sensor histidine kinase n=1 Tax=Massilia sp. S19_KUP03_FR1 TaxID=3025503 RepID=UPI002FCDB928
MQTDPQPNVGLERIDARVLLVIFVVVMVAGIWLVTLAQLAHARTRAIAGAQRDAQGLARVFEEHAVRTIEAADQAVTYLRFRYNALGITLDVNADLQRGLNPGHLYNLFTVVDAHGDTVLSSQPFTPTNLSDREHIRVHVAGHTEGLFISKPVLGRVSKKWSIQLTRRIEHGDGSFKGVVVASMDPYYFTRLYDEVNLGARSSIALIGDDGVVHARRVGQVNSIGQDLRGSALFAQMQGRARGTFSERSPVDQVQRLYGFEKVAGYPLTVLVGLDYGELLADYDSRRDQSLLLASVASAAILLFGAALVVLLARLIESRKRAISASQAKSRFLSNMSHELRTPLNGILGFNALLREGLSDPLQIDFAETVETSARQLLAMVDAALELSALESGQQRLDNAPAVLADVFEQALSAHRAAATAKGLHLALRVDANAPPVLVCDRARLVRVLDILLSNAVGFTATGHVLLHAARTAGAWDFAVEDTGVGVPLAHHASIFKKFSPSDDSASRARAGAGLGLAIAAQLVALMGGSLTLASVPGQGATFRVSLPQRDRQLDGPV